MVGKVDLWGRSGEGESPCKRFGDVQDFFKPWKFVKLTSYVGLDLSGLSNTIKSYELILNIPKAVANAESLFDPKVSYWKKTRSSVRFIGTTARSVLWANRQSSFLSPESCGTLEKVSEFTKVLVAGWGIADSAISLAELSKATPRTTWEARLFEDKMIAYAFSLVRNILKLLFSLTLLILLFAGLAVSPFISIAFYVINVVLAIANKVFDNNVKPTRTTPHFGKPLWQSV